MTTNIEGGEAMPRKYDDAAVVEAMRELDGDIHSLLHMAHLTAEIFSQGIGLKTAEDEGSITFRVSNFEHDQFSFLTNDVAVRAAKLDADFRAALEGRAQS